MGLDLDGSLALPNKLNPLSTTSEVFLDDDSGCSEPLVLLPGVVTPPDLLDDDHRLTEKLLSLGLQRIKHTVPQEDLCLPNLPLCLGEVQRLKDSPHGLLFVLGERDRILRSQTAVLV